jgi:hypothetical protein
MTLSKQDADKQPILGAKNNKSYQAVNVEPDSHTDSSDSESLHESNEDIVAKRLNGAKRINVLLGYVTSH